MRLCAGLALVALLHGGCSIDDRVLRERSASGGSSGGGGRCDGPTSNACEACLFESCCSEAQACGEGSECLDYLGCAESCAGDQACVAQCGDESPRGLLDALDLGVCSQRQCPACAAQRDAAFDGCNPSGAGACESAEDCSALEAGAFENLDVGACPDCEELTSSNCVRCLSERTGLSEDCSECVAEWLSCAVVNCLLECEIAADEMACQQCLNLAGCTTELGSCGFSP